MIRIISLFIGVLSSTICRFMKSSQMVPYQKFNYNFDIDAKQNYPCGARLVGVATLSLTCDCYARA